MTVTIVGNRKLEIMPVVIMEFMAQLPVNAVVQLRRGRTTRAGRFERIVAEAATRLWLTVKWCEPNPEDGEGQTYFRDVDMVASSDVVLAFFAGDEMSGGTEHVVEKAMDPSQLVPVYSYGVVDGRLIRIGEHDPNEAWSEMAPKI